MHFGNIRRIGFPWRAAICATMRVPSDAFPVPERIGRLCGTSLQGHESERMGFTSELRHPTMWYAKLAIVILALAFFTLLAAGAVSGYLVYRMVSPARSHSDIDLQNFPGHPQKLNFTVNGEGPRDGWFFPGLKSAPTSFFARPTNRAAGKSSPWRRLCRNSNTTCWSLIFRRTDLPGGVPRWDCRRLRNCGPRSTRWPTAATWT